MHGEQLERSLGAPEHRSRARQRQLSGRRPPLEHAGGSHAEQSAVIKLELSPDVRRQRAHHPFKHGSRLVRM
jgi:hypothetical protein